MFLFPSVAAAASLEQSYLAARDAQIRKVAAAEKKGADTDRVDKIQEKALAELQKQLAQIIGASKLSVPGIKATPKINIEALSDKDQGFDMLDGLAYASEDYKTRVVVTTEGLLKAWMLRHRKPGDRKMSQDPAQDLAKVLASEEFYTQAVNSDATLSKYAELPIKKPAAASTAYAMYGGWAQDDGPWEPEELVISVIQGGKLYVVRVPASTKLGPFAACQAVWDKADRKANEVYERAPSKPKVVPDTSKIREQGAAAFRRCFAEHAPKEKGFAGLVRQAQTIVDGLPVQ
ncbi:hypothetical protein [Rhodoplanes sp. Z2-YC6860]|uniref:hypothetical protein n=1 Tax=Rhodoplanes sp. Z2-YC6860 TaxID=674703 RepID=UPI0012EE2742|nr:hypothetical protein [Rhodoplanes sp. Z2-YC6860]